MLPQYWKYKIGQRVRINKNAKIFYPSAVFKNGYIIELLQQGSVDYGVKTDDGNYYRLREEEIDIIGGENVSNKIELHQKILDEIHELYKKKNADYGDSFSKQYKEWGIIPAVARLDEKISRIKQLIKNKAQVKDESIEDTIKDLCNYSAMLLMELREDAQK